MIGFGEQLALVITAQAVFTREKQATTTISYHNVPDFFLEGHYDEGPLITPSFFITGSRKIKKVQWGWSLGGAEAGHQHSLVWVNVNSPQNTSEIGKYSFVETKNFV